MRKSKTVFRLLKVAIILWYTLYSTACMLHPIFYSLYGTPYILQPVCYTLYYTACMRYTLYSTACMLHPIFYSLYATSYILQPVCYTLYSTACMLHPICYILYATPCMLVLQRAWEAACTGIIFRNCFYAESSIATAGGLAMSPKVSRWYFCFGAADQRGPWPPHSWGL